MPSVELGLRAVLRVAGSDAKDFLQGVVTCDLAAVASERPGFGALLTPQGKIVSDFFLHELSPGELLVDCPKSLADDLLRRLRMYRLRAKVELADVSDRWCAVAVWEAEAPAGMTGGIDPRLAAMGWRGLAEPGRFVSDAGASYLAHRVLLGIPEGGSDFAYGETFPHDANMDLLQGVHFQKGCYIGQEVVARVQHRGSARRRILRLRIDGPPVAPGTIVTAGGSELGITGSAIPGMALAQIRTDRLADAVAAGHPVSAGGRAAEVLELTGHGRS